MNLKKFVIHELQKEAKTTVTKLILSKQMMIINNENTELIKTLIKSYRGDKLVYANLKKEKGKVFPDSYNKYIKSKKTDLNFLNFSHSQMANLETIVKSVPMSKGGYFFFTEYEENGKDFTTIFLIRDTSGKTLNRSKDSFTLRTVEYLDTSHLAMACRINYTKYSKKEENHITFTRQKQAEVSDYFMNWINVEILGSTTEYTNTLYTIFNKIERPKSKESGKEISIDELRSMVFDFANSNADNLINVRALSQHLYGNEDTIPDYIEENDFIIDTEFRFDRTALKKFIQVSIRADGINLKFSKGDFGTKVKISKEDPTMVIIKSEDFAKALKIEEDEN
ncbi:nucleoid-associated protein [Cyclobacterium plantarum]|uniref:nucleoid-associated protein n=1 Tax=Cyclobacterium plantarum TaxID=2716263 RepID=UPI003F6EEAE2